MKYDKCIKCKAKRTKKSAPFCRPCAVEHERSAWVKAFRQLMKAMAEEQ